MNNFLTLTPLSLSLPPTAPQRGSTASNCSFVTSADLDRMKAEILEEMRAEMNKMQEEIIAAIRNLKWMKKWIYE